MDENTSFAMSCISPPDRDYEILRYLHATILLIGCVLSVLGNTLNLLVHRKLTAMSEPTKVLYIFLSVADLITGISFSHSALASIMNKFPLGCSFSVFCAYFLFSNTCTSVFLILLITIDCFVVVIFPFRYPTLITKSRTIKVCCISMVMCMPSR